MPLATPEDVEKALGRPVPATELDRVTQLITLASAAVAAETGYRFEPGSYTIGRVVRCGRVKIPAAVDTVTEVRYIDRKTGTSTVATGYTRRGATLYRLTGCYAEVDFTVTDAVPAEIVALVAGIVAATVSGPPVGAESASAGPYSVSYVNSSGRVWFSASDRLVLRRYRTPSAAVALA